MLATAHATVASVMSADPVFAAIEAHREALHVYEAEVYYQAKKRKGRWVAREEMREAAEVYEAATSTLVATSISTLAGLRVFTAYVADLRAYGRDGVAGIVGRYAIEVWDLSDAMTAVAEAMAWLLPADAAPSTH